MNPFEPYVPEDFDDFWAEAVAEAQAVRLFYRRKPTEMQSPYGHRVEEIEFTGMGNQSVYGWIAYPDGAKRLPSFVWVPPYGRESLLPNRYGTRDGMVSLSLNLHHLAAFHQEKYIVSRGYFGEGVLSPETWVFRRMIQDVLIAVRVLQAQSEADEDRIGIMGMSQGGGLSLWAAALSPIVRAVVADMPFLGAMHYALTQNAYRYPLKEVVDVMENEPIGRERVMHTMSYYDTMNFATRVQKPCLVTLGLKDPACRPAAVRAIYEAVASPAKALVEYPGGHDWHLEMVQNNAEWFARHFSG